MKTRIFSKISAFLPAVLCATIAFESAAQPNFPRTPQEAEIIYTDLQNFVEAYNELSSNPDTLMVLQEFYFDRGSAGLKEFVTRHQLTPELMRDAMAANPDRYALIPDFLANIGEVETIYKDLMMAYGEVLPDAMYAPTYLLVGANRGIGQASFVGQLVTITRVVDDTDKLKKLMTHELSHFQQAMSMGGQKYVALYAAPNNMLGLCLREGGAEFITSLVLNDITQREALAYIEQDEENLKAKFIEDLKNQDTDFWLWASLNQKSYPKLLGYAMGYTICRAYYDQASDKSEALQAILQMQDAEDFMASSQYFKE